MYFKIAPGSRLTIIFILAVAFSGSVLTWFSINNISNLKELTEKRIREEQGELAARFLSVIAEKLENITSGLTNEIIPSGTLKDSLLKITGKNEFISQPFILKNNGQFIYPYFKGIPEDFPDYKISGRFAASLSAGEKAEFTEKNIRKAKDYYLVCLNYSGGSNDSVKALNALGRISVKLNFIDGAVKYYNLIILDYSRVTDGNGIPYVNYALPQLLKITNADNQDKIMAIMESCLGNMETGIIPVNYNTEELLNQVTAWIKENSVNNNEKSENIIYLTGRINQQVQFVITYGNELAELVKKENQDNYPDAGNGFKVVNGISENSQEFFLINTNFEDPAGFMIDRKKFLDAVLITDLQSDLEFDHKIELPGLTGSNSAGTNLVYTPQLTPWLPDQAIEIKLANEDLIRELVKRRSWIYGFASVLLLVAMGLGVALILRDIARERNIARLRSDFISNVTHELKTPLTSIRMYAESLLMGRIKTPDVQKEYLEVVVNESERLKRMINNILEFSKMEKGIPGYHFVNSNLASIIKSAMQEMNYWLEKENFEIVSELDRNITAEVDPEKMKQVIENLLSNAIKYSTDKKKIFVRLYKEAAQISIEVEDCGLGIPEDKISRIFEAFYRVEQKESISGTGLGLTVVKEIVEAHHGKISVASEIGKGSVFVIMLNQQAGKSENNPGN